MLRPSAFAASPSLQSATACAEWSFLDAGVTLGVCSVADLRPDPRMPIPSLLARKLREVLGMEAGEEMVAWIDNVDAMRGDIAELRHLMEMMEARLTTLIERRFAEALRWSWGFAFACSLLASAVAGATVVLALRH